MSRSIMKHAILFALSIFTILYWIEPVAACLGPGLEQQIFFKSVPKDTKVADFIGEVSITSVSDMKAHPGLKAATGTITKSQTHPGKKGEKITLLYYETSCGPYIPFNRRNPQVAQGLVLGAILPASRSPQLTLRAYSWSLGREGKSPIVFDNQEMFTEFMNQ